MKARIATIASFAGVLVAGSAAAMVNSQVLHNTGVPKNSVQNVAPLTVDLGGSTTTAGSDTPETVVVDSAVTTPPGRPTATTAVTEGTQASASTNPATTATKPSGSRARYRIGDAGDVVLDTAGDRLTVVATDSASGWRVTGAVSPDALNTVVTFQSATRRVVFHASLLFGVVGYSVSTYDLSNGGAPVTTLNHEPTSGVTTTVATPTITTPPATTQSPTTTTTVVNDRPRQPRPSTSTTEPRHHRQPGDPGSPSTTTPRWGSGNGQDD
jgi:hypothetical protein